MTGQEYDQVKAFKVVLNSVCKNLLIFIFILIQIMKRKKMAISKRVYIFSAIALFILLIACINYMNLSTARSTLRAKEIGIRKVVGAQRKEIIVQFLK